MILKVNSSNQLYALRKLLKGGILTFVVLPFFKFQEFAIVICSLFFLFISLPAIYLHLVYYLVNRKREIVLNENELTVKLERNIFVLKKSDCNNIIYGKLSNNFGTSIWNPMYMVSLPYNYVRIITHCGKSIIITSLMCRNLNDVINEFRGITIRRTNNPFFWPKKEYVLPIDKLH